jgi:hypothetical protein
MAATALRHFVAEVSNGLGKGRREADPCPLPALSSLDRTQHRSLPAWPWPQPPQAWHSQPLGKVAWESWPFTQSCPPLATTLEASPAKWTEGLHTRAQENHH